MSSTTKIAKLLVAAIAATILFGCGSSDGYGVAKDPNVVPPKPYDTLTKEEKLERINKLPIPEAERVKMRAELNASSK